MKQYLYTEETVQKNFLASYADAWIRGGRLFLVNTLTDRQMILSGEKGQLEALLLALHQGVSDTELQLLLEAIGAQKDLEALFREGLVE